MQNGSIKNESIQMNKGMGGLIRLERRNIMYDKMGWIGEVIMDRKRIDGTRIDGE
jgi:hypothetical protein